MKKEALNIVSGVKNIPTSDLTTIAATYNSLGDKDQAFFWLQKAYDRKDPNLVNLNVMPQFDSLRSDTRFQQLLHRMNVPQNP
jgi:hypothetical protein